MENIDKEQHTVTLNENFEEVCDMCDWRSVDRWAAEYPQEVAEHLATQVGGALEELAWQTRLEREIRQGMTNKVVNARYAGASWADIGALLGVSRQAAHAKYSPICQ